MCLRIVDAEFGIAESDEQTPNIVFETELKFTFDDPLTVYELAIGAGFPIPKAGLYHCELLVNGNVLMSRRILAVRSGVNEGGSDDE